ncbi:hypothetical protein TW82_09565 [Pseudoalteromonas fuliginea]|nr:hypothetical protein TW82_09565 [Pseudoalteromonas fuliginea]
MTILRLFFNNNTDFWSHNHVGTNLFLHCVFGSYRKGFDGYCFLYYVMALWLGLLNIAKIKNNILSDNTFINAFIFYYVLNHEL